MRNETTTYYLFAFSDAITIERDRCCFYKTSNLPLMTLIWQLFTKEYADEGKLHFGWGQSAKMQAHQEIFCNETLARLSDVHIRGGHSLFAMDSVSYHLSSYYMRALDLEQVILGNPETYNLPALLAGSKTMACIQEVDPGNQFRRTGKLWEITYQEQALSPIVHCKGMTYIHHLLQHPGETVPAFDLYRLENPPHPDALDALEQGVFNRALSRQTQLSPDAARRIKTRLAELQQELESGESDLERRESIEDEIEKLQAYLKADKIRDGAVFEDSQARKHRQNVCKAIRRAVRCIAEAHNGAELAKHLLSAEDNTGNLVLGKAVSYHGTISWTS